MRDLSTLAPLVAEQFPSEAALSQRYPHRLFQTQSRALHRARRAALEGHAGVTASGGAGRERLASVSGPGAGAWLTARPAFVADSSRLARGDWEFATRFRLGLPQPAVTPGMTCTCGLDLLPTDAHHVVRCRRGPQMHQAHAAVVQAVASVVADSGLGTQVHTAASSCRLFFPRVPDGARQGERIPDVTFTSTGTYVPEALDVTVVQAQRGSILKGGRMQHGAAAAAAERRKHNAYAPWMEARGSGLFTPLAVEPYGCFGTEFMTFIRRAGQARSRRVVGTDFEDETPALAFAQLYRQRIGVALQRAQAQCFRRAMAMAGAPDGSLAADEADSQMLQRQAHLLGDLGLSEAQTVEDDHA